jgi:predicted transcriptional regulator
MSRRGKLDIIADILTAANRGSKKTKLVYATNTNFVLMKEYLQMLEKRGLVLQYDAKIYTTDAGREYLLYYSGLTHLLKYDIRGDYADIKPSVQARKQ